VTIDEAMRTFAAHDAARRTGAASGPGAAVTDRLNEGALIRAILGPAAPLATVPAAVAAGGYEGIKALGQSTGLGRYLPGPFRVDETTSPASSENVIAFMRGLYGDEER
jgi:hypothetical protein